MHAEITTTTTTSDADALNHWGVTTPDEPIRLQPFPCGRYVCPNHQDDQATDDD